MAAHYALDLNAVINPARGWYGGALTPLQLAEVARREGLDFFAITDHNTVDAYPEFASHSASRLGPQPDLCIIPGIEITYPNGHYNVFGLAGPAPWQEAVTHGPTVIKPAEAE